MKISKKLLLFCNLFAILLIFGLILFVPSAAHAQGDLHGDLVQGTTTSQWVFNIWRVMLGIADVFVVIVLLFLATVNILHLSYDTYAIKKSLPLFIGGVIAANFSVLICRMIVDAAQVLTVTFAGDGREIATGYLCALTINPHGGTLAASVALVSSATGLSLIMYIVVTLVIVIAVLVLSFLLWIRKTVILGLVAISPVAFILYAFPPTQGLFKQWWNQFLKWVFMGPIVMIMIWMASQVGASQCNSSGIVTGFNVGIVLTVCGLTFLAAIIPFKLGGAVMGAWGKAGKWGASKADYGLAKKTGWSPGAAYQAYKANANQNRDRAYAQATGNQRDFQNSLLGRKSRYGKTAERAINQKLRKETGADIGENSMESTVREMVMHLENGDEGMAYEVLIEAAEENRVGDILKFAPADLMKKSGALVDAEGNVRNDMESQRAFMEKVVGGDWEKMNRVEEGWTDSGIINAKRHPIDAHGQPVTGGDPNQAHIGRFHSKQPNEGVGKMRLDGFLDQNGVLNEEFFTDLKKGMFSDRHLEFIARGRGRDGTYDKLTTAANWEKLGKSEEGRRVQQALTLNGSGPVYAADHADHILMPDGKKVNIGAATPAVPKSSTTPGKPAYDSLDLATATPDQVKDIQSDLIERMKNLDMSADPTATDDPLRKLNDNIHANAGLAPIHVKAEAVYNLRLAAASAKKDIRGAADRISAETAVKKVSADIVGNIGLGMEAGVDPRRVVFDAMKNAGEGEAENLKKAIKDVMNTSTASVLTTPTGSSIKVNDIISNYAFASRDPVTGKRRTDDMKIKIEFSQLLDKQGATPAQKAQAWQLVEAYEGKEPPATKKRRGMIEFDDDDLDY